MKKNFNTEFVDAAREGDTQTVKELFEKISTLETKDEQFYFALYFACFYGKEEIVQFLLENHVDANFVVGSYLTPLHAATFKNHDNIVELLLNHGANVNPKIVLESGEEGDYFCSPLIIAAYNKNEKVVAVLLKKGANVNSKLEMIDEVKYKKLKSDENNMKDGNRLEHRLNFGTFNSYNLSKKEKLFCIIGFTALHFAVKCDSKNMVGIILNYGADVNSKCSNGLTPLCLTCENNNLSLAKTLVEAGADIKCEVNNGKQLLGYCVEWIMENYVGKFNYFRYDKLEWVEANRMFSYFIKIGADPNGWSTARKGTILHYAASKGIAHTVHILLKNGANANAVDGNGKTPLEYAVSRLQNLLDDIQKRFSYTVNADDFDRNISEERQAEREADRKRQYENRKIYNLTHNTYIYDIAQYQSHYYEDDFHQISRDPVPYRMISQLLTRELVRLEALGTKIVHQNVKLLESTFVKPYYNRCKNELKKLKKFPIVDGLSYYNFLLATDEELTEYMEDEKIASAINKENCRKLFPNFSRFLLLNVKRGLKRKMPDVDEDSNGSSDDDVKHSKQMRNTIVKRWMRIDDVENMFHF